MYKKVDPQMNLPKVEESILKFWDEEEIFQKTLDLRKDQKEYSFYDGPPFATGTPHYGHIVASTMKDVVPRYWTMRGYKVPRLWGWDCHGLPIENIAEKMLGINRKKDIEKMGVEKFNDACRSKVLEYVGEWEKVIRRLGRWADMKNAYKTMDLPYMESVWAVFKDLYDKGLIYEGYRSMHICPRCETTLSQSEVAEGYKTVKDLSLIAKFELIDEPGTYLLAWTTTPWTLIGNAALAVGADIQYVKVKLEQRDPNNVISTPRSEDSGVEKSFDSRMLAQDGVSQKKDLSTPLEMTNNNDNILILAKERLESALKDKEYKIVEELKGQELIGKTYRPLFDYYQDAEKKENGWKVYDAPFVTTEEGTGIVHIAPAFGEDDMNLGKQKNLPFIQHVGMDGIIKSEAKEFAGLMVKPAEDVQKTDVEILKYLANKNLLFGKEQYEHSYPHCWRCETPLLNYATSSWFVAVTKVKEKAIELAKKINWSPKHIKEGRFGDWLEGARDWSISRQRYWASVIPIWRCECGEIQAVGSVAELEELSGKKVIDLHKHIVDKIVIVCKCGRDMHRIPDVLDTWFDSGSMPYAQLHYPFENKERFEHTFPADFIAEGVDQTRAWFYYLHLLATATQEEIAFENVIVNGIVLAEDGKKMSKRLQNYPDPMEMFHKYGADAVRFYLLSSPVMQAENLNFSEKEVAEYSRGMFRMLWNAYYFFTLYAGIDKWEPKLPVISTHSEPAGGRTEEGEKSQRTSKNLLDRWMISELNQLTLNVNAEMENYNLTKAARLFVPFIDNLSNWYIRRSRKRFWKSENDNDKNVAYQTLWTVLTQLSKLMAPFTPFLAEEIFKNTTGNESVHLEDYPVCDKEKIDAGLNDQMNQLRCHVESGLSLRAGAGIKVRQPLARYNYTGSKLPDGLEEMLAEELNVEKVENSKEEKLDTDYKNNKVLVQKGLAREIIRNIQSLRKNSGFQVSDRIIVSYQTDSEALSDTIVEMNKIIAKEILAQSISSGGTEVEGEAEFDIEGDKIWFGLSRIKE